MLSIDSQRRIEELLIEGGLLSKDDLERYKVAALQANEPFMAYMVENKLISEEDLTRISAQVATVPYVKLTTVTVKDE